jgi:hypothetical protein
VNEASKDTGAVSASAEAKKKYLVAFTVMFSQEAISLPTPDPHTKPHGRSTALRHWFTPNWGMGMAIRKAVSVLRWVTMQAKSSCTRMPPKVVGDMKPSSRQPAPSVVSPKPCGWKFPMTSVQRFRRSEP